MSVPGALVSRRQSQDPWVLRDENWARAWVWAAPAAAYVVVEAFLNTDPGLESMRTQPREASRLSWSARTSPSRLMELRGWGALPGCWDPVPPHCQQVPLFLTTQTGDRWGGVGSLCPPVSHLELPTHCPVFCSSRNRRNLRAPPTAYLLLRPCHKGLGLPSKPYRKRPAPTQGQQHGQHGLAGPAHLTQGQSGSGESQALIQLLNGHIAGNSSVEIAAH